MASIKKLSSALKWFWAKKIRQRREMIDFAWSWDIGRLKGQLHRVRTGFYISVL